MIWFFIINLFQYYIHYYCPKAADGAMILEIVWSNWVVLQLILFLSRASTNPDIRQMVCLDLCHIGCIVLLDFPYLWCVAFFYFLQFDYWYVYAMSGFVVVSYKSCSNSCGHDSNLGMHVWGYISGDVGLPISFWSSWFSNRYFLVQGAVACWPCFQQSLFFSMDLHLIALHICMSRLQKVQRLLERQG